jgi:hypothetical protein
MEVQSVRVIARLCGNYAAFSEISIYAEYDLTNDIQLSDTSKEDLIENVNNSEQYCDYDIINAIKIGDNYYMKMK